MKRFGILFYGESYGQRHLEDGFEFLNYITRRKMVMLIKIGTQEEQTV